MAKNIPVLALQNISIYTSIKPIIAISGNTADLVFNSELKRGVTLFSALSDLYGSMGYDVVFNDGERFINFSGTKDVAMLVGKLNSKYIDNHISIGEIIREQLQSVTERPLVILFDGLLLESSDEHERKNFCRQIYAGARDAERENDQPSVNSVVLISKNRICDMADDALVYNETISLPTQKERADFLSSTAPEIMSEKLVALTEGLGLRDLSNIASYISLSEQDPIQAAEAYIFKMRSNPFFQARLRFTSWQSIYSELKQSIYGQDEALEIISKKLFQKIHSGEKKPVVLFLAGPTASGKTLTSKKLCQVLFGSEQHLFRYDMSYYKSKESIWSLLGSPAGYVNHNDGVLVNNVKKRSFAVHLFDEIEKASEDLYSQLFLPVLEEGVLNSNGETLDFSNTVLIFTSNIGYNSPDGSEILSDLKEETKRIISVFENTFRPEFNSRLYLGTDDSSLIVYRKLDSSIIESIVVRSFRELEEANAKGSSMLITVDDSAVKLVTDRLNAHNSIANGGARGVEAGCRNIFNRAFTEGEIAESCVITARDDRLIAVKKNGDTIAGEFDIS